MSVPRQAHGDVGGKKVVPPEHRNDPVQRRKIDAQLPLVVGH